MMNNSNLSLPIGHNQQNINSNEVSLAHHNSTNIYEEIRPTLDHPSCCCCCCSCTLSHYRQQQYIANSCQLTPHYYTCEPLPSLSTESKVVCQTCLLETLHRKQHATSMTNCVCRNFFIPIK